ncbi:MAG: aldolase [Chloroflexi bacterium]|nr:aldolase [Chloroflexota bacterium]
MFVAEFQKVGQDLFLRGLVSSHGGNMSLRLGEGLVITRRGAQLGHLTDNDLIETGVEWNDRATPSASSELAVHRAIYQRTQAQAIVHAHPVSALALSLMEDEIVPLDAEGRLLLERVPVIGDGVVEQVRDVIDQVALCLKQHHIVMVRGHGSFAVGQLLDEAHRWTSLLEESCRLIITARLLGEARVGRRSKKKRREAALPAAATEMLRPP